MCAVLQLVHAGHFPVLDASSQVAEQGLHGPATHLPEKDKTVRGQRAFQTDHGIAGLL